MGADVLIFKTRRGKVEINILENLNEARRHKENSFIKVNIKNPNDLALFFSDLKWLWGAPVDRAILAYNSQHKESAWPF